MSVRKSIDYSAMFSVLDTLMTADLSQMKLYCEIGRLVSERLEKGAAVAASEYLYNRYPDQSGFSPRNLRRMREFYSTYRNIPGLLSEAMTIGWTQNVVILEADLTLQEKVWYIQAVQKFNWSKLVLVEKIKSGAHTEMCHIEENHASNEKPGKKSVAGEPVLYCDSYHHYQENWNSSLLSQRQRLRPFRPPGQDGQIHCAKYLRRCQLQDPFAILI